MEQHEATLRLVAAVKKAEAELRPLMAEAGIYLARLWCGGEIEIQGRGSSDMPQPVDHIDGATGRGFAHTKIGGVRVVRVWPFAEPARDPAVVAMDTVTEEG